MDRQTDPPTDPDAVASQFVSQFESEVITKLEKDVVTLKQLCDTAAGEEAELAALSSRLLQETEFFFDLNSADPAAAAKQMAEIVQKEEQELEAAQRDLSGAKEAKERTKKELNWVVGELDRLRQEEEKLESQQTEWQDLKRKETSRVVSRMMRAKFRLDKDSRCVSLHLDDENRVETVILVPDKENEPQSDLRNSFWDKLSKTYSAK